MARGWSSASMISLRISGTATLASLAMTSRANASTTLPLNSQRYGSNERMVFQSLRFAGGFSKRVGRIRNKVRGRQKSRCAYLPSWYGRIDRNLPRNLRYPKKGDCHVRSMAVDIAWRKFRSSGRAEPDRRVEYESVYFWPGRSGSIMSHL